MLIMDTLLTEQSLMEVRSLGRTIPLDGQVRLVWCCNNKGPMRRDLVIYAYPTLRGEDFVLGAHVRTFDRG